MQVADLPLSCLVSKQVGSKIEAVFSLFDFSVNICEDWANVCILLGSGAYGQISSTDLMARCGCGSVGKNKYQPNLSLSSLRRAAYKINQSV